MTQTFDQLARYYDLLHQDLTADIPYILDLAENVGGPILELGCGSGRLLLPLAEAGFEVTGLDRSSAMLALARRRLDAAPGKVAARVVLVEGEMSDFSLEDNDFAFILNGYNTLLHLPSNGVAAMLASARRHLRPEGQVVIDTLNPLALVSIEGGNSVALERVLQVPASGEWISVMSSLEVDEAAQTARVVWLFDVSPAAGGAVERTVIPDRYYFLYPHQLEMLLQEGGFALEALYGDYDRAPYDEDAERLIAVARLNLAPGPD